MINLWLSKVLCASVLVTSCGYLQAQVFDLEAAVAYALEHSPELNVSAQQLGAASAQASSSRAGMMPVVTLSTAARLSNNPLDAFADKLNTRQVRTQDFDPAALNQPGSSDLYFTRLALRWPVYTGGRTGALIDAAEASELNRRLQYQREREYTAFATTQAYLTVLAAEQGLVIAQDAVAAGQEHADTTKKLAREGRIVESDKLAAEVSLAALRSQSEQANTHYKTAMDEFKLIIGLSLEQDVTLADASITPLAEQVEISRYEQQSLEMRKDLAAVRSQIQAAQASVAAARSARMPSLDIVASTNWYDDSPGLSNNSSSIMGVLSMDLYDGQRDGKVDLAMAQQRETQWQLQALEQTVRKQVRAAYYSLIEARARLAIAEANVTTAKRTVALVQQRYGQGRTILLDLLQSERLYTGARLERLSASLQLDLAQVALPLAAGVSSLPVMEAR